MLGLTRVLFQPYIDYICEKESRLGCISPKNCGLSMRLIGRGCEMELEYHRFMCSLTLNGRRRNPYERRI